MPATPPDDASMLLAAAAKGDAIAARELLPLIYADLRAAAQQHLAAERPGHTLSATALVHEAYLRLAGPRDLPWAGKAHFYAAAAESMRRILIDHARARHGRTPASREARLKALAISGLEMSLDDDSAPGFLALEEALGRLEHVDPRAAGVVRLRFYAGLDTSQAASALGVSERSVKRDWAFARGWLREDLARHDGP